MAGLIARWNRWWFPPVPLARLHVFRALIYLYVPLDVLTSRWVAHHGLVPASWYEPLRFARALGIPAPTAVAMGVVTVGLCILPLLGAAAGWSGATPTAGWSGATPTAGWSGATPTKWLRRTIGPAVALLYFYWCFVAFTYGKVDHDRVALLVALAVLPTVPWRGSGDDERAGWALSMVQASFVLTYFLAGVTKLLVGGAAWVTSTTIERAIARRGTMFGDVLLDIPWVLVPLQFLILAFELTAPLMLLRNRIGRLYVWAAVLFHVTSLIGITIYFRSHLVCVLAFFPLERLYGALKARRPAVASRPRPDVVYTD